MSGFQNERYTEMSTDYYIACGKHMKALHVAQDGPRVFIFFRGQPGTMKLLGEFLEAHALCGSIMFLSEHAIKNCSFEMRDSLGELLPNGRAK